MSNLRLPPAADTDALLATYQGACDAQNRRLGRERQEALRRASYTTASETRRRNTLSDLGLTEAEWPMYQRIRARYGFKPAEAAGVVIRSRRDV